jgi:hypothetical protein
MNDGRWEEIETVDDGRIMGWWSTNSRTCYTPGDGNEHSPGEAGGVETRSIHPTRQQLQQCLAGKHVLFYGDSTTEYIASRYACNYVSI